jgi:hypothetical protein
VPSQIHFFIHAFAWFSGVGGAFLTRAGVVARRHPDGVSAALLRKMGGAPRLFAEVQTARIGIQA